MSNTSFSCTQEEKERKLEVTTAVENMLADVLARRIVSQITEAMQQAS